MTGYSQFMIRLASFLGNPGREHSMTRHNLPWLAADRITLARGLTWQRKFKGSYASVQASGGTAYLHKPMTYMNLCGGSLAEITSFFKIPPGEMLVVHDDVEMEPGEIGLKYGGGMGGHKGLRSIAEFLGTKEFYRLRIGVGRPLRGTVSSYVLKKLKADEIDSFEPVFVESADVVEKLLLEGTDAGEMVERLSRHKVT